ncbi:MAG: trypsin-like peptidase domain-containing protein [Proteobacteria bacterium]|nr:trypsin-like peptidase domain-containing protein [Pseudomonadota bacterium]
MTFLNLIRSLVCVFSSLLLYHTIHATPSCDCSFSFAPVVEQVLPAVVDISIHHSENNPSASYNFKELMSLPDVQSSLLGTLLKDWSQGQDLEGTSSHHSLGSGFIIDPMGYIVTNRHVVQDVDTAVVSLSDGREMTAQIIARDARTDLALLKVETKDPLPSLKWGDSHSARVGDWILVVGSPFGFGRSVSAGIISARARDISRSQTSLGEEGIMSGYVDDLIQTDASINLGNSGGPMINTKGEVIGVNVALFSPSGGSIGIGFSVPSSVAERAVQQMIQRKQAIYGWMGIRVQEVRPDMAKALGYDSLLKAGKKGAFVSFVDPFGPAAKSGILPADIILSYDGLNITAYEKLPRLVGETDVGKKVMITLWRNGKEISLPVIIEEWSEREREEFSDFQKNMIKIPLSSDSPGVSYQSYLGVYVTPLTKTMKSYYKIPSNVEGVLIVGLEKYAQGNDKAVSFPALDIQVDDIIEEVNQTKITSFQELENLLQSLFTSGKNTVLLKIWRHGITHYIALNLGGGDGDNKDTSQGTSAPS